MSDIIIARRLTVTAADLRASGNEPSTAHGVRIPRLPQSQRGVVTVYRPTARNRFYSCSVADWTNIRRARKVILTHVNNQEATGLYGQDAFEPCTHCELGGFRCRVYEIHRIGGVGRLKVTKTCSRCRFDRKACSHEVSNAV